MTLNATYYLPDGTPVVFLGNQDVKHFGFFRELRNPDTFFGFRLSRIRKRRKITDHDHRRNRDR